MALHTACGSIDNVWDGPSAWNYVLWIATILGIVATLILAVVAATATVALLPERLVEAGFTLWFTCLMLISTVQWFRDFFFDHKLICLGGDKCVIAQVSSIEANADGDRCMNTILAPAFTPTSIVPPGASLPTIVPPGILPPGFRPPSPVITTGAAYHLMFQPQMLVYDIAAGVVPDLPAGLSAGLRARGYTFNPEEARKPPDAPYDLPFFHCEIEGTLFDDKTKVLLAFLYALLVLAAAVITLGLLAIALGPFLRLFIAALIFFLLALFAILAFILGGRMGGGAEDISSTEGAGPIGVPGITGPVITDSGGQSIMLADYVAILGRHVCDAGHKFPGGNIKCWNEFHPVKAITKIMSTEYYNVVTDESNRHMPGDVYDQYCDALRIFVTSVGEVMLKLRTGEDRPVEVADPAALRPLCLEHRVIG